MMSQETTPGQEPFATIPENKVHHATKLLFRALKVARQFEQRKLARKKAEKRDELLQLKAIDLMGLAQHCIDKRLNRASKFTTSNLTARLINTKPVKEAKLDLDRTLGLSATSTKPPAHDGPKLEGDNVDEMMSEHSDHSRKTGKLSLEQVHLKAPNKTHDSDERFSQASSSERSDADDTYTSHSDDDQYQSQVNKAARKPKKNRKGQRARRQEALREHGSEAKHLQSKGPKKPRQKSERASDTKATLDQAQAKSKGAGDSSPLHPSWEAAKRAKEQRQASFQGKKVVFD